MFITVLACVLIGKIARFKGFSLFTLVTIFFDQMDRFLCRDCPRLVVNAICITYVFAVLVLNNIYRGELISLLTSPLYPWVPDSLRDVTSADQFKVVTRMTYVHDGERSVEDLNYFRSLLDLKIQQNISTDIEVL